LYKSQVTYDDDIDRVEVMKLWGDVGNVDTLYNGPKYKADIVSDDYDIEIGCTKWGNGNLFTRNEWRLEKRKLHFWTDYNKPVHFVHFNKYYTECLITFSNVIQKWVNAYPVEYRECRGWPKKESYFLIIPYREKDNMKYIKKIDDVWIQQKNT